MIKAVVIDDEVNSRELFEEMLANYIAGVKMVGTGKDVKTGIAIIKKKQPEIVFLDIEMPGGDGFKILDAFENIPFKVIFVTGFQEYALRAIKYSALDYILKPINLDELQLAIDKVKERKGNWTKNYELLKSLRQKEETPINIAITGIAQHHIIPVSEILAIAIRKGMTVVIRKNEKEIITTLTLLHFEQTLNEILFMRIHKQAIVNLQEIATIDNGRTGNVHLKNNLSLPFSSRKKTELLNRLKNLS